MLALGIIAVGVFNQGQVDILAYLYGDILAITWHEVNLIGLGALCVIGAIILLWRPLLSLTVHAELAEVEGVPVQKVRWLYVMLLALVVSVAIKMVGVLLITAMLVIPAAASRPMSVSPSQMAILASGIGIIGVILGLFSSYIFDIPAGPAIVCVLATAFFLSLILKISKR